MGSFKEHCEDCLARLGNPFPEVNRWLDELQPEYGPMHRPFRHHAEGIERVRAMWGDDAAKAAAIHIRRDCGCIPPCSEWYEVEWGIDIDQICPEVD